MAWIEAVLLLAPGLVMVYVTYALRSFLPTHSHPSARRLGWQRSFLFLLVPLVPFWNASIGFMLVPAFLAMAAFNIERLWILKSLGSEGYLGLLRAAVTHSSRRFAIVCNVVAGLLVASSAGALWLVTPNAESDWGWRFAAGLGLYGLINSYERSRAASRLFPSEKASGAI
jgi:hypothetical protein